MPVFAPAELVMAALTVWPGPTLMKPSPAKSMVEPVLLVKPPLKLTVPVPATENVVEKTGPLKVTVFAFAPAATLRNVVPVLPTNPVTVEEPLNTMLAVLAALVVMPPPASLPVLMFWAPTVRVPGPVVSTPLATPTALTTPGRTTVSRASADEAAIAEHKAGIK